MRLQKGSADVADPSCGESLLQSPRIVRRLYIHIHERPDWPRLHWRPEALADALADVRHRQGRLLGRMETLGFDLRREAVLGTLVEDVVKSSDIEGEELDAAEVARRSRGDWAWTRVGSGRRIATSRGSSS